MRCSTARSFNGIKLEVGASVIKNHAVPTSNHMFRDLIAATTIPDMISIAKIMKASSLVAVKGMLLSTLKLNGKKNNLK